MSEIADLRDLQREYEGKRDTCYEQALGHRLNILNTIPGPDVLRSTAERAETLLADARKWQERIEAIQRRLDELIGMTND